MANEELFFDALKSHRKSQNIEISEICEFTKINSKYIEAIEIGDFNILPTVYMRLFLREYAKFIGADSVQALEDFEFHTTGKVDPKRELDTSPKNTFIDGDDQINHIISNAPISPKQILTGMALIISIFLILYWAGEVTKEQSQEAKENNQKKELNLLDSSLNQSTNIHKEKTNNIEEKKKIQ